MPLKSGLTDVLIKRDAVTEIAKTVPAWEVPVLVKKWPGKLTIGEHRPHAIGEFPDPEAESSRLAKV